MWLILTLITGGAFAAVWFIYWMIRDAGSSGGEIYTAKVVAAPESPTQTRLSISASREDWARTLEGWVQQELVENKAAKGPLYEPSDSAGGAGDIPRQIERLAELRDAGVITTADFEEKKRDLLNRMQYPLLYAIGSGLWGSTAQYYTQEYIHPETLQDRY